MATPSGAAGFVVAVIPADDLATGDPAPPDQTPPPDGLDEPPSVPDDSVVEYPPTDPAVIPNANSLPIAWVGTPEERPDPGALLTLQAALNAAPAGGTVSFDPNDYAFTGSLAVSRSVNIDSASASTIYGRFIVNAGGLQLADHVSVGVAATGAVITVIGSGVTLTAVTVRNPNAVPRPIGVQLAAGITDVVIDRLSMDASGEASSYGVNLTTGSATITDPNITGVAIGVAVTPAATATGSAILGGQISAATSGISLGTAVAPQVTGTAITGQGTAGTGLDLANSSAAAIDSVGVAGFDRGIGASTTNTSVGPTIVDATIVGTRREGISLGATTNPAVTRARITGAGANQSTGILILRATGATIDGPIITGMMYGITTHLDNAGAGPAITAPQIEAFGAITLGSTQGATVTGAILDAGSWGVAGTGINLVNSGRAVLTDVTATGFLYAVGSQSSVGPGSDRRDIVITNLNATGAPGASSGVYLLGAVNASITDLEGTLTGAALVIHQSVDVHAQNIVVHGREGLTSVTGAAILRAYGSQTVTVDDASIDAGSYGFFYSGTDGATVTNAAVSGVVERGVYGRSVANLDVSSSTFTNNAAVGMFVVTTLADGISHDIAMHDNVMTGNLTGIHVLLGTTGVRIASNTVSAQPEFVRAGSAHDVQIIDNSVHQENDAVAISVVPQWQDGPETASFSSSAISVTSNTFTGAGTWISVGSPDPTTPDAQRRTMRDPVLVTGNIFPAESTAVQTFPNAVIGDDSVALARALPVDGPIAVDARDYDDPNDWGSGCRATGYLDGAIYYDGGGATVLELTEAPVLYPMNCLDLSLVQVTDTPPGTVLHAGDVVSWTLTPHNAGPRVAPPGWVIEQLLSDGFELVSMSGDGYSVAGATATASEGIPVDGDGPPLRVVARIAALPGGSSTVKDVAYIDLPPLSDLDEDGFADTLIEQISPLVVPVIATDTDTSPTDNDVQGLWRAEAPPGGRDRSHRRRLDRCRRCRLASRHRGRSRSGGSASASAAHDCGLRRA